MNNTFKIRDFLKLKRESFTDASIASTFIGVATKDCKAGDIVTVNLSSSGSYRIFPFKEEVEDSSLSSSSSRRSSPTTKLGFIEEVSYGKEIIDTEILRFEKEKLKKDKKVIAKKKRIIYLEKEKINAE